MSSTDPADLGVVEAASLLAERTLSATELTRACLARIRERDGTQSHEGDPGSINAWVRVYEHDALEQAAMVDQARLGPDPLPKLAGVPIGLKDLYAVAGKPLTASSRLLDDRPERDCDVWAHLRSQGMVLLGHLHTHEFAVGGTTDQVGNPWALDRSAGGSSGGSAAALAARMVPAATGTDTAGSLRIPSALSGTSTVKPTRGLVSLRGVVPLAPSLDHAGPMARTLEDCALLLGALPANDMGRPASSLIRRPGGEIPAARSGPKPLAGIRMAVSPRTGGLDGDVADGLDAAIDQCRALGADLLAAPQPPVELEIGEGFLDVFSPELLAYHRRFDGRRDGYRPSLREWIDDAEARSVPAERYVAAQARRRELTAAFAGWLVEHRISALIEATVPCVAPLRGAGYDHAGSDDALISLTHTWDWTGSPVVALPSGVGSRSGLPVGVSLIGRAGTDWHLLDIGIQLQAALGAPAISLV